MGGCVAVKLNCKPGDLAVVIRDEYGVHEGKIVLCKQLSTRRVVYPSWETEPRLIDPDGRLCIPDDALLRPIRDNDKEDETLTWAGLPHKETA